MATRPRYLLGLLALLALPTSVMHCADDEERATGAHSSESTCKPLCFEAGDPNGHPAPQGAKAAGQARAGRITSQSQIKQPADARQRVQVGDFLIANDKIGVYIEDKGLSDGYARFGGEIMAVDLIGDDGLPIGKSYYGETLTAISSEMIDPDSVTVLQDGSDGKEAVVRVMGPLKSIPFLGSLKALFPRDYGVQAIYDFILEPGSSKLKIRLGIKNTTDEVMDLTYDEMHGFFQSARSKLVTHETGYVSEPKGSFDWVGFDAGESSFAWRTPGRKLNIGLYVSGYYYFTGTGFTVDVGEEKFIDYVEVIPAKGGFDALAEAVRVADGDTSHREVTGKIVDAQGSPVEGAYVHQISGDGATYLSRAITAADGSFVLHAPSQSVKIVARKTGYGESEAELSADKSDVQLALPNAARIHVVATEEGTGEALPVRVQVIPTKASGGDAPAAWGESTEANGRLHQAFPMNGDATLAVPAGEYKVIVSRGYEWELYEETVAVADGEAVDVKASLTHSVDTTGVMCADFHIHSYFSADSSDHVIEKVKSAVADGLDIPVSSEHEWIIDFQPIVEELGVAKWAHGIPSEELTTFTWGHFGVLPLRPKDDRVNRGALDWIGTKPPAFFKAVHEEEDKPILIINHPSGGGFGAYFSSVGFKRETAKGKDDLWSDEFEAVEVFNDSDFDSNRDASVGDWFALLNHGRKVWAVGSSDSHSMKTSPVGYPRSCIWFGHDDPQKLDPDLVRDGVVTGNVAVSGGLYMTVRGANGEVPGSTYKTTDGTATFEIDVRAPSWIDADNLEVIVNGNTVATEPLALNAGGPGKHFHNTVTVALDPSAERNWVVFHARGSGDLAPLHPGRKPFAASNPVFLE